MDVDPSRRDTCGGRLDVVVDPRPGDVLMEYFFPAPSWRRRLRAVGAKLAEVTAGAVALGLVLCLGSFIWKALDAGWCGWRLERMNQTRFAASELEEDLELVFSSLLERHPRPLRFCSSDEMEAALAAARVQLVDGASRQEFLRVTSRLVAGIGCGHTAMRPCRGWIQLLARGGRVLPLGVRFVAGRAFVVEHYGSAVLPPLGSELLTIDGSRVAEIRDQLLAVLSADGPDKAYALYQLNDFFFFLHAKYFGPQPKYHLRYRAAESSVREEIEIVAEPARRVAASYWRAHPERDPRHVPFPLHPVVFAEARAAYLWVPTFAVDRALGYRQLLDRFFRRLRREGIETLVVDVRGNGGGPSIIAVDLLRYLIDEPFEFLVPPDDPELAKLPVFAHYAGRIDVEREATFAGRLVVLVDGGSFSTTGHFCAALAAHRELQFVGETSGGGSCCQDNGLLVTLPNSGLRLRVATAAFDVVAADDTAAGVCPDLAIEPTVGDLIAGRDPVLAAIGRRLCVDLESTARELRQDPRELPSF